MTASSEPWDIASASQKSVGMLDESLIGKNVREKQVDTAYFEEICYNREQETGNCDCPIKREVLC